MKRIFVVFLIILGVLNGCAENKESVGENILEINLKDSNNEVSDFVEGIERDEEGKESGIYMYTDSQEQRYLYLNQDFLESDKDFGDPTVKTDKDSANIYLKEIPLAKSQASPYKLYKINFKGNYEYLKVFKNGKETYFTNIGA